MASSMKAATARNDIERPRAGSAPGKLRYTSSAVLRRRGGLAMVQSTDVARTISSALIRSRITYFSIQRRNAKRGPFFGKQHGGGYQYKPLYTSPGHSYDCTGSAVLDQGVRAK